jgi:hypothetical protein
MRAVIKITTIKKQLTQVIKTRTNTRAKAELTETSIMRTLRSPAMRRNKTRISGLR